MTWKINLKSQAESDLAWFYKHDRQLYEKCCNLIRDIANDPFTGIGKPERLKHFDGNAWSRRVNLEHRMVYLVDAKCKVVDITHCRYHY